MLDGQPPFTDKTTFGPSLHAGTEINYARNPMPANATGWAGGASLSVVAAPWDSTRTAARSTSSGSGAPYIFSTPSTTSWSAGDVVHVSATVQAPVGHNYHFGVHRQTGNVYYNPLTYTHQATGSPQRVTATFTLTQDVPADQIGTAMVWRTSSATVPANGTQAYMGDIMISKGKPLTYFSGSTPGAWWSGTPNASQSLRYAALQNHAALTKGANSAIIVGNANRLSVDAPIMKRDLEHQPFTIEATFRRIEKEDSAAQQQILGTSSAMDGLVIAGTMLSFTTKYANTGEARCEYDLQTNRAVTVMAVHTNEKNSLYVNGERVAEVNITPEQQADTYLSAGTSLTSGTSTSTNLLALNGLAIFQHPLEESDALAHFNEASDTMDEYAVAAAFGGTAIAVNAATAHPIVEYTYDSDFDWQLGGANGVIIDSGSLTPQVTPGEFVPGTWEAPIALPPNSTLSSVVIDWRGIGAKVETSTDGNSWYEERRNSKITPINDGFSTEGRVLFVRVTLPNADAYLSDMVVSVYGTTATPTLEGRPVELVNASIESDYDVTEYHEDWGVQLENGSYTIPTPEGNNTVPRTIQAWVKSRGLADSMSSADTVYTNGGPSQPYKTDEWQLRTYVFVSGFNSAISFTGTGQVGPVIIYSYAMTPEQVAASYTAFTGTQKMTVPSHGAVVVYDVQDTVEIYEYDWAIESAG